MFKKLVPGTPKNLFLEYWSAFGRPTSPGQSKIPGIIVDLKNSSLVRKRSKTIPFPPKSLEFQWLIDHWKSEPHAWLEKSDPSVTHKNSKCFPSDQKFKSKLHKLLILFKGFYEL